jgi:hypothetical protein
MNAHIDSIVIEFSVKLTRKWEPGEFGEVWRVLKDKQITCLSVQGDGLIIHAKRSSLEEIQSVGSVVRDVLAGL